MGYNQGVKKYQKEKHKETLQLVMDAVEAIRMSNPHTPITRKLLLNMLKDDDTGIPMVAPATLYKDEYLKIWNPSKWEEKNKNHELEQIEEHGKEIEELTKEVINLRKIIKKNEAKIEKKDEKIEQLLSRIEVMKTERRENEDTIEKLEGLLIACDEILAIKKLSVSGIASNLKEGITLMKEKSR
ncbi:hypothetical protein [Pontibacillus sp. HMF3514]|uniref:hypothetical protein n=1 Tax=Pontibacillus sp. HMF3514 TaxID=2692425 RepID=UPI00131FA4A5|nr:hypothetical protein [Pontibacillus sp. HMF3514]QHE52795.1 hypothetical protein GS400_12500 [Pontibacillus sp. HMF3514]